MRSKPYDFDGFVGDFKDLLVQFVKMKQSMGFDYITEANALKRFSKFTLHYSIENYTLTKEMTDAWTEKRPNERDVTWMLIPDNLKTGVDNEGWLTSPELWLCRPVIFNLRAFKCNHKATTPLERKHQTIIF